MKRVILFVLTNIAVVFTISILLSILSATGILPMNPGTIQGLMVLCLVWGMAGSFISLLLSRFMAKRMMGVKLIDGRTGNGELDRLYNTIQNLAQQASLPMPEVGIYESPEVNAFATGPSRNRSLVAVSTGLLRQMGQSEVQGVLGHEIAHIKNGDMVTMALLQGVINAFVMFFARIIASLLFRGSDEDRHPGFMYYVTVSVIQTALSFLGALVVCWFSRQREFRADAGGAELAGQGSMVAALRRAPEHPAAGRQLPARPHHPEDRGGPDGPLLNPSAARAAHRAAGGPRLRLQRPVTVRRADVPSQSSVTRAVISRLVGGFSPRPSVCSISWITIISA